jgi:hypothetical protein
MFLTDLLAAIEISLVEELAAHCIKSTPTPEFLSKLGHFDISCLPYHMKSQSMSFLEVFDAVNSKSHIPKFLVWLHQQVSPELTFCTLRIKICYVLSSVALIGRRTITFTFMHTMWTSGFTEVLLASYKSMKAQTSEM